MGQVAARMVCSRQLVFSIRSPNQILVIGDCGPARSRSSSSLSRLCFAAASLTDTSCVVTFPGTPVMFRSPRVPVGGRSGMLPGSSGGSPVRGRYQHR